MHDITKGTTPWAKRFGAEKTEDLKTVDQLLEMSGLARQYADARDNYSFPENKVKPGYGLQNLEMNWNATKLSASRLIGALSGFQLGLLGEEDVAKATQAFETDAGHPFESSYFRTDVKLDAGKFKRLANEEVLKKVNNPVAETDVYRWR